MKSNTFVLLISFVCAVIANLASAQSTVITLEETVTGNQEQPKVLYIVPWKTAANAEEFSQTISSQLQGSVFEHIERAELRREVKYLESLNKQDVDPQ
ncbi:hypothetical protein [Sessilibacter sp. MAH2]